MDDVDRSAKLLTLRDFEAVARERLDPVHYDYVAGGARDEVTVRANEAGFQQVRLLPRVLRGRAKLDLGVTLFGDHSSMPVVISPTAFHKLADLEGELATARAAALADTIMIVSMASTTDVRNVADAARAAVPGRDPRLWFQLYLQPDLEDTAALVRRATEAGCSALVVTVDSPVLGVHDRNKRNGFTDLPAGMYCENLRDLRGGEPGSVRQIAMSPELSWEHVDWLRGITSLPVVLKGVLHPQDARLALRHGVDGLLLSNHGGRQLDTVPATIELLPEFLDAVGGAVPVLVDGGVRRGTDVAKAVALGAAAAGVGRPIFWALAADGQRGVSRALEILRGEIEHTFALCGAGSVREMTRDLVRAPVGGGLR
ncbi:MAG TPA: alpha-hydroxy acid oxidase [Actinocrinis sp.]|nr:alpha-hydroxy acid oxidase [Actinocrinis sp.]